MKILFSRSRLPGSYLIRWLTFSQWSHVALLMDNGDVIEATWPKVRKSNIKEFVRAHPDFVIRYLDGDEDRVLSQIGKDYDISGLFMFLNPWRDWTTDDKWFCSELIAYATGLFTENSRVSPQMLYLVSKSTPSTHIGV